MKRLILALVLLAATPLFAFNTTMSRGDRVGVLQPAVANEHDEWIARAVSAHLLRALRDRGLDAFDAGIQYDELVARTTSDADYYVEVVSGVADADARGGVGVWGRSMGVDVAMVVSNVAARLRIYDGRTFQVVDEYDLERRSKSVMPVAISAGGRHVGVWFALPVIQQARLRAAARAVAREAAQRIAVDTVGK
jgi:hypothetical protein